MKKAKEPIFLAWSGGKDCALALYELLRSKDYEVCGLLSCVQKDQRTVALRAIDQSILEAQAQLLGMPIYFVEVENGANCREHVKSLAKTVANVGLTQSTGPVQTVAFGDVYLDDIRDCREELLEAHGLRAIFPLWHRDTRDVSYALIQKHIKAVVTCIDSQTLTHEFLGRIYDQNFVNDLPITIDPCGENGEFHTVVTECPDFERPLIIKPGRQYLYASFYYQEILSKKLRPAKKARVVGS